MDKKFLSSEEALELFGLDPVQFEHLIEEGELRALADRGTWKYRRDEIEGLIKEGLLTATNPTGEPPEAQTLEFEEPTSAPQYDDLAFLELDEEALTEGATMIKKSADEDLLDEDLVTEGIEILEDEAEAATSSPEIVASEATLQLDDDDSDVVIVSDSGVGLAQPADEAASASTGEIPVTGSLAEVGASMDSGISLDQSAPELAGESSLVLHVEDAAPHDSDSDVRIAAEAAEEVPEAALTDFDFLMSSEVDRSQSEEELTGTSSVVLQAEKNQKPDSDSDVKIYSGSGMDSGIDLEGLTDDVIPTGNSGVLASEGASGILASDSDVRIADSGISLEAGTSGIALDSGMTLEGSAIRAGHSGIRSSESGITLEAVDSGFTLEQSVDSGITLDQGDESGISLEGTMDSGISLEGDPNETLEIVPDSGLTLEQADSGMTLEPADSGMTLEAVVDSGISLEESDSGLSLDAGDSGIAMETLRPRMKKPGPEDTQAELDDFSDRDFAAGDQTALIALDDDDAVETIAPGKGPKARSPGLSQTLDDGAEVEDLEIVDDLDAGEIEVDEADDIEALDDDAVEEEVLDASDEAFSAEDDVLASSGELSAASMPSMAMTAREPSWGVAAILPIAGCALLLAVQALILWDGVSTMWTGDDTAAWGKQVIEALGGLI